VPPLEPSWAESIGSLYSPTRRNPLYSFRHGQQQFHPVEIESQADSHHAADEWYDQSGTQRNTWFSYFRRNAGHAPVPNEDTASSGLV
jgi:hypothetical protein